MKLSAASLVPNNEATSSTKEGLHRSFMKNLELYHGKLLSQANETDLYNALARTIADILEQRLLRQTERQSLYMGRTVSYLSAEFLIGPQLEKNIFYLGLTKEVREVMFDLGLSLDKIFDQEPEPGLGNGGLGRLAACFLDSLATLNISSIGYGIRYEFGIFYQRVVDGWQVEQADAWLANGNPWERRKEGLFQTVNLGGYTENFEDEQGVIRTKWVPKETIKAIPYDTPMIGYHATEVALLRLWKAEHNNPFDIDKFNDGDYEGAVYKKVMAENITKVLYPNDNHWKGLELRLKQQYFFCSASLHDMMRIHLLKPGSTPDSFDDSFTIQLNDTHPAISVVELMRILVDDYHLDWNRAWKTTQNCINYTNHTLLPEALEKWSIKLFQQLLPRHLELIYELNHQFLKEVASKFPGNDQLLQDVSLIDESGERFVRMAHVACLGSGHINGVAALHTRLLTAGVLHNFHLLWPEKFSNKTNGVTLRRWLISGNPKLAELIVSKIGDDWIHDARKLKLLEGYAKDPNFQREWQLCKLEKKQQWVNHMHKHGYLDLNPNHLFDVLVKRIHEYKRQLLKVFHVIALYIRYREDTSYDVVPRTVVIGGKAAPSYFMAKLIIKLINNVIEVLDDDKNLREKIRLVFIPNFSVKEAQLIYPAADLSEQISMAGKEASGTGNMKFMLNGALTIGTLDGANVEIREEVGPENFFLFGLRAEEVIQKKREGYYPMDYVASNPLLSKVISLIEQGHFSPEEPQLFKPLIDSLIHQDEYMLLADFQSYLDAQDKAEATYRNTKLWTKMSILNTARSGKFSSDRTIEEYLRDIWKVDPVE